MKTKKIYRKKPNYKKLIISLIKKKYLSLVIGIFFSYFLSLLIYRQFIAPNIHFLNSKKTDLFFLRSDNKKTSQQPEKEKKKEKKKEDYQLYTVLEGDSLSSIAEKFYGDLYRWPVILEYNDLANPDLIEVGMVLKIPKINK